MKFEASTKKEVCTNVEGKSSALEIIIAGLSLYFLADLKTRALACCSLKAGYLEFVYKTDILASPLLFKVHYYLEI